MFLRFLNNWAKNNQWKSSKLHIAKPRDVLGNHGDFEYVYVFKFIIASFIKFNSFSFTFLIISCLYKFFLQYSGVFLILTNFSRFWWSKLSGFNRFLPAG